MVPALPQEEEAPSLPPSASITCGVELESGGGERGNVEMIPVRTGGWEAEAAILA